mmetsp:Transcript_10745/g.30207  ORF Transcript_10745/g.30207 Transcript_10745/m.30207 type:complete len:679 (-) Transcript_10745:62-2098(-)
MLFPSEVAGPRSRRISKFDQFSSPAPRRDVARSSGMCKRATAGPGVPAGEGTCSSSNAASAFPRTTLPSDGTLSSSNAKVAGQTLLSHVAAFVPPFARSLARPPFTKRKIALLVIVACVLLSSVLFASLYTFHRGFRRTVQFWKGMGPLVMKYKLLKLKATKLDKLSEDDDEYKRRITAYREKSAPQLVDLILSLGGIYVKIGQVMSTIGQGLLPDEYVEALRPLQDGVPARSFDEVSSIIEKSTSQKMGDLFVDFDQKPIGAASIGQAHKATLRSSGEIVVVKVQYPEVAELFEADLSNLETATRLFAPDNVEVARALRKRHENELDFSLEAENLRQCTEDMQAYGVEPSLVRIPRVLHVFERNVLIMEYLKGVSLGDAIEEEQNRVAKALGKKDARELKSVLSKRMREHFESGGGAGSGDMKMLGGKQAKIINVFGPAASTVLRSYAGARDRVESFGISLGIAAGKLRIFLSGKRRYGDIVAGTTDGKKGKIKTKVNLSKALKTLVHVSGLQLMLGRSYNADPHPGNVLIMDDGRLALLDYGMVGKLSQSDRQAVAETIVALSKRDKAETARVYRENGYRAAFRDGTREADDATLHRFASFHLDRIDLSPLTLDSGETVDTLELLRSTREKAVPKFVEEGRRLGGLLMGVSAQAARPISLSKEWLPIAERVLRERK